MERTHLFIETRNLYEPWQGQVWMNDCEKHARYIMSIFCLEDVPVKVQLEGINPIVTVGQPVQWIPKRVETLSPQETHTFPIHNHELEVAVQEKRVNLPCDLQTTMEDAELRAMGRHATQQKGLNYRTDL